MTASTAPTDLDRQLEQHRGELRGYCYRMLASPFDADDAVQETLIRAWKSYGEFEQRASLRSWLYRIATNVCIDMQRAAQRRARPMDLGPAAEPIMENLHVREETTWLEPSPDGILGTAPADPAEAVVSQDSVRLAFIAALQHLPPKQRAALILCEVLQWKAAEVAELLDSTTASVNSALQRARATIEQQKEHQAGTPVSELSDAERDLLVRYVKAFEAYDIDALTTLIHEDATQSMPPFDLWLSGRDDIFTWWLGPGIACKGSRVLPTVSANGSPAFGQYKIDPDGGYSPWALQVLELRDGGIGELTFFLSTEKLFPLFGLPLHLDD